MEKILKFLGRFSHKFRIAYWIYTDGKYNWGVTTYLEDIKKFPQLGEFFCFKLQNDLHKELPEDFFKIK
jgi:hypothetical protein